MPGLSFAESLSPDWSSARFSRALDALRFDERYVRRTHLQQDGRWLATVAYPEYPVQIIETRHFWMCLDGYLYGLPASQQRRTLTRLATLAFDGDYHPLRDTLTQLDGAFVAFLFHKQTKAWAVINDGLGRLPLYHWTAPDAFYLSRDFRLFTHVPSPPAPDRLGMAQQLMLSYPLGQRTLLDGVKRLPPCTLVRPRPVARPQIIPLHVHDFGGCAHANKSLQENAQALADRFETSCTTRARHASTCVVALSGGLDSRAVALGLQRAAHPFETITFIRPDASNRRDVEGAAALADRFGFNARTLSLPPTTSRHVHQLLRAKGGLNPFDVGFVVSFLESVLEQYGPSAHLFTGDVGVALRDLRPASCIHHEELMSHILQRCWFSPALTARLTGVSEESLLESIRERLATYPEPNPTDRFKHFLYEWIYKFSFEGEDRNRYYCWSSAPLLSEPFVTYALQCPDEQKARFKLYRAFLQTVHPRSLDIGYSDFLGIRMTPFQLQVYRIARMLVRAIPGFKRFLQSQFGRRRTYSPEDPVIECMQDQVTRSPAITDYFAVDVLNRVLDHPTEHPRHHIDGMFTLLSFIEELRGSSTLLKYQTTVLRQRDAL
jgi:asparagine synthase (glutamine-hydrolysing)